MADLLQFSSATAKLLFLEGRLGTKMSPFNFEIFRPGRLGGNGFSAINFHVFAL